MDISWIIAAYKVVRYVFKFEIRLYAHGKDLEAAHFLPCVGPDVFLTISKQVLSPPTIQVKRQPVTNNH